MNVSIETITPERAAEMLARNYASNRTISKAHVHELADSMRAGSFDSMNGQTIVVGTDGTLYDGQHRLSAIVETGIGFEFIVFEADDAEEAYKTIDMGKKRKASDYITLKNASECACYGNAMIAFRDGRASLANSLNGLYSSNYAVPRYLVVRYCNDEEPDLVESDCAAARKASTRIVGLTSGTIAKFMALVRFCGTDEQLEGFIEDMGELAPTSPVTIITRDFITASYCSNPMKKPTIPFVIGTLLHAYESYRAMKDTVKLNKQKTYFDKYAAMMEKQRGAAA